jgi:hypothetical protein
MFLVRFYRSANPINEPVTKFGGQPVWIAEPQWPIGRTDGKPMRFICQVLLPREMRAGGHELAYVFMSDEVLGEAWDADFGDNAVILQPGPFEPHVKVQPLRHGPTLEMMRPGTTGNRLEPVEIEYLAELDDLPDEAATDKDFASVTRIGGPPGWLQTEQWPAGGPWRLIIQVDSCTDLYSVNFGDAGIGYALISEDGRRGRFLWQCL